MYTKQERTNALEQLRELLQAGDIVYTHVEHVARSGMSRNISVKIIRDNAPRDISWLVSRVIEWGLDKDGNVRVGGCGMDMGFHLVYTLSSHLYRDGFTCIGQTDKYRTSCPSNDHSNGERDYAPHNHRDGGYALRQEWL